RDPLVTGVQTCALPISITVLKNSVTVSSASLAAPDSGTLDVEPTMWDALANWSLVFRNDANAPTYVRFVLQKGLVSTLFSTVPFLLFLYGAAQLGWWVGLRPIRERTRASSLVMKGDALASASAHDAALCLYDEAVRLDPTFVPAILGRATTLARLNRRPEAIETYKQLLSKDAKNLDALRGLGRMLADDR